MPRFQLVNEGFALAIKDTEVDESILYVARCYNGIHKATLNAALEVTAFLNQSQDPYRQKQPTRPQA